MTRSTLITVKAGEGIFSGNSSMHRETTRMRTRIIKAFVQNRNIAIERYEICDKSAE